MPKLVKYLHDSRYLDLTKGPSKGNPRHTTMALFGSSKNKLNKPCWKKKEEKKACVAFRVWANPGVCRCPHAAEF